MSSLPTRLPSSVELLQLLQEQAALQLLISVRSSVFLVRCCTVRGRSTCFGVFTQPPRVQYRYNRSCAIERTCWRVVTLRTNNFLPSADTSCWVLSSLSTIHASTLYLEEGTRSISLFQRWFLLGNHNHQANPHVHQQHVVLATTFRSGLINAGATQTETSLLKQHAAGERVDLFDDPYQ